MFICVLKHCSEMSQWVWMAHTSHHGLCTAFRNICGKGQLHQVNVPILNKEELPFFGGAERQWLLGAKTA